MLVLRAAIAGYCAAAVCGAAAASAQEPYFKGKQLTLLIGSAAGGPTDIEGRLFAKYLARHIAGQPTVIVQNKDGAGGLVGRPIWARSRPRTAPCSAISAAPPGTTSTTRNMARRLQDLRVRRLPVRHHHRFRAHRRAAGHEAADRYRQGAGPGVGGLSVDNPKESALRLALDMLGRAVSNMSPAIAPACRRGSRCSAARFTCSPNRRRATAR